MPAKWPTPNLPWDSDLDKNETKSTKVVVVIAIL